MFDHNQGHIPSPILLHFLPYHLLERGGRDRYRRHPLFFYVELLIGVRDVRFHG